MQYPILYNVLLETCSCQINCISCGACTHMYDCSCMDSAIHSTVCKHVHIIHLKSGNNEKERKLEEDKTESTKDNDINDNQIEPAFNTSEYFSEILQHTNTNEVNVKKWIENSLQKLHSQIQTCDNLQILNTVKSHISTAMAVINANKQLDLRFEATSNPPPNACHQKQFSFHSTKQKQKTTIRWSKPTLTEASDALKQIDSTEVIVCGICWKEEDKETHSQVQWIACSTCDVWVYNSCTTENNWENNEYICRYCNHTS